MNTLSEDLAFERDGRCFRRELDERWTFDGRIFGGYSGALLITAMAWLSELPEPQSAAVSFLRALRPGPVEVTVEPVRAGRSSWVGRATVSQEGKPALIGDAWFAADGTLPPVQAAPRPPPGATPLDWFTHEYPFMNAFVERAVDYPLAADADVPEPPPRIRVCMRADDRLAPATPLERQLLTFMFVDAHIIDAALRPGGLLNGVGLSHNLAVHWTGMPASDGWFELDAAALISDSFAATKGELRGGGGAPCAWALQQGRRA